MKTNHFSRMLSSLFLLAAILYAAPLSAHEKWFHDAKQYPLDLSLAVRPVSLMFLLGVSLMTVLAGVFYSRRGRGFVPGPESFGAPDERRSALYGLMPLILGIHVAVPLLVNGVQGRLFSPDNQLAAPWSNFVGLAETGIALALFYGAFTRLAAVALAILWLLGIFIVGLESMLENTLYLGAAAFFFLAGRGPFSIDRFVLPRLEPPANLSRHAVTALRVGLGISLIVVAFTEKFANIPLAQGFLQQYPLNFTRALGIPMSNEIFILCAGSIELLAGLWILFGIFPREIVLVAWVPINLTLTVFNWGELIGHLPIYGMMSLLLLWSPGRENLELWVRGLREGTLPIKTAHTPEPHLD